jgi:hypothetical protein
MITRAAGATLNLGELLRSVGISVAAVMENIPVYVDGLTVTSIDVNPMDVTINAGMSTEDQVMDAHADIAELTDLLKRTLSTKCVDRITTMKAFREEARALLEKMGE